MKYKKRGYNIVKKKHLREPIQMLKKYTIHNIFLPLNVRCIVLRSTTVTQCEKHILA